MADNRNNVGVIFDMDGVLVDSAEAHWQSWRQLVEECGGHVTREEFQATFGLQNRDIVPKLVGPVNDEALTRLSDRKEELYRAIVREDVPIVPGAVELVRALHQRGVFLAVGSSGPPANIQLILSAMGVQDLVRVIVSGDDVHRGKPAPDVFLMAAQRLGFAPNRCVVVEDAPAGVQAAKAAGCKAVAVLMHHPRERFCDADAIVERLGDLSADELIALAGS